MRMERNSVMEKMEHSKIYYTTKALEKTKSAGLGSALTYYGLKFLGDSTPSPTRKSVFNFLSDVTLLRKGRIRTLLQNSGRMKRAGFRDSLPKKVKPLHAVAGAGAALGVGLGIRALIPSRFARVYINEANAKTKRYVQQTENNQ